MFLLTRFDLQGQYRIDLFSDRPRLLKMPAVIEIPLLKILRCAVGVHFVSNCVYFTRFRCAENGTQGHFRCVMVCYRTHSPQRTRPE